MQLEAKHEELKNAQEKAERAAEAVTQQQKKVATLENKKLETEAYLQKLNQIKNIMQVQGQSTAIIDEKLAQGDQVLLKDMEELEVEKAKLTTLESQSDLANQEVKLKQNEYDLLARSLIQHSLKATLQIFYNKLKDGEITKEKIILFLKNLQYLKIIAIVAAVALVGAGIVGLVKL
jgi:hypothetical protein